MRRTILMTTVSAVALLLAAGLGGCGSLGTLGPQVLDNLQGCERHYNGAVSAGLGAGFTGTVQIDCPATPVKAEETTAD